MKRIWLCIFAGIALGELPACIAGAGWKWGVAAFCLWAVLFCCLRCRTPGLLLLSFCFCLGFLRAGCDGLLYRETSLLDAQVEDPSGVGTYECRIGQIGLRSGGMTLICGQLAVYCEENAVTARLRPGNRIRVAGRFSRISGPSNPGEFHYRVHFRAQGITHRVFAEQIECTDASYQVIPWLLYRLRRCLLERLSRVFEDPEEAAFLRAAMLGDRSLLEEEQYDQFRRNGIAHLLAISGLHISILGMGLFRLLRRMKLGLPEAALAAGIFLTAYNLMTGSQVSTLRAVLMLLMVFFAGLNGRTYDLLNAAGLAGTALLLINPYTLFTCSFLLSFGAILSIGLVTELILTPRKIRSPLLSSLLISCGIQLLCLPVISGYFFELPLQGPLLNLAVIPLMSLCLWSGAAALILPAAGASAHYIFRFYIFLCRSAEYLKYSRIIIGRPMVIAASVLWGILQIAGQPVPARLTFLDVGQGDGIFLQAEGRNLLIDAGSTSTRRLGKDTLTPFLKSSGVRKLDLIFVTHGDQDHISGILSLLEEGEIPAAGLCLPVQARETPEPYAALMEAARRTGTPVLYLSGGSRIRLGERSSLSCLSPDLHSHPADLNEQSLVLLYEEPGFTALLTGDAGQETEQRILSAWDLPRVTVLKCGHHGSNTSTGEALLRRIRPVYAVLSCGEGNPYGHPHRETLDRLRESGARILQTRDSGAVTFTIWKGRVRLSRYLEGRWARLGELPH